MSDLFPLADRLRELREEKDGCAAKLKDVNSEIGEVEQELSEAMATAECASFSRGGKTFVLTTTTRWSAEADRKEALYAALRENGYGHLFTVNSQTLGSFVREMVKETEGASGETHVPGWLSGLVKSYDDIGVTMRTTAKKL
jgi:hypothetical protein